MRFPDDSQTDPDGLLLTGAATLGLTLSESVCRQFRLFREELQHWNTRLNLTGLQTAVAIVCKHFLDSLAVWPWIKDLTTLADLGTGAGFPGLPLKLVRPDLRLTLVEATGKKVAFLKYVVWRLGLDGVDIRQVYATPALGRLWGASFQGVVTRATWPLPRFLALAAPLLLPGGLVLSLKGPGLPLSEWQAACQAAAALGLSTPEKQAYQVPDCHLSRQLICCRRLQLRRSNPGAD